MSDEIKLVSYDPKRFRASQQISNVKDSNTGEFSYNIAAGEVVVVGEDAGKDEALTLYPSLFEEVFLPEEEETTPPEASNP